MISFYYKVDSQYPSVQRLIVPKPASIATNPIVDFKGNLTASGEFKKTNQSTDKNLSVSMCLFSLVFEYRFK